LKFFIGKPGNIPSDKFLRLAMIAMDEHQDVYREDELFEIKEK